MINFKEIFKKFLLIFFAVLTIFLCFSKDVYADKFKCPFCGAQHEELSAFPQGVWDMYTLIYAGEMFDDGTGSGLGTAEVLRFDIVGNKNFKNLWKNVINEYYKGLLPLGQMMVVIYILIEILQKTDRQSLTPEHFSRCLIKLFIAIIVMNMGFDILSAGINVASGIFDTIKEAPVNTKGSATSCIYDELGGTFSLFDAFAKYIQLFIPWLLLVVARLSISIVCWSRILDIAIRAMFAPIGMSDLVSEGMRGKGFKYLKKLISSALQGAVIIGVVKAYGIINKAVRDAGGIGEPWIIPVLLAFVVLSLTFKSKTVADDIVGL